MQLSLLYYLATNIDFRDYDYKVRSVYSVTSKSPKQNAKEWVLALFYQEREYKKYAFRPYTRTLFLYSLTKRSK
jgi:hypothetical protein